MEGAAKILVIRKKKKRLMSAPLFEGIKSRITHSTKGVIMKLCTKCVLPETYETIEFDNAGVCNVCHQQEHKQQHVDWTARKADLDQLIEKYRGKHEYDCIIPFSGGKDSTYTLWYLVKEYKLKPLVVMFDHGFMRPTLLKNNERTFKQLGVDVLRFTPNWKVVKRLMLEALIRKGDFCWHCHTGIFSYPMHVALKYQTPLIFWGEPSSEYAAYYDYRDDAVEMVDEKRFNRYINLGITAEDMFGMINDPQNPLDPRDLAPYTYPELKDLKKLKYHSVCLGSYIPWDARRNADLIGRELGWQGEQVEGMPQGMWPYEKIECFMQGIRDYIKYIKRGYSRVSQMATLDIRHGRLDRETAMRVIKEHEGKKPRTLPIFLEYVGLTEDEFNEIVAKTAVPPYEHDFTRTDLADPIPDLADCFRETT
jgi:N-acetyl sugar amidotransferase